MHHPMIFSAFRIVYPASTPAIRQRLSARCSAQNRTGPSALRWHSAWSGARMEPMDRRIPAIIADGLSRSSVVVMGKFAVEWCGPGPTVGIAAERSISRSHCTGIRDLMRPCHFAGKSNMALPVSSALKRADLSRTVLDRCPQQPIP